MPNTCSAFGSAISCAAYYESQKSATNEGLFPYCNQLWVTKIEAVSVMEGGLYEWAYQQTCRIRKIIKRTSW